MHQVSQDHKPAIASSRRLPYVLGAILLAAVLLGFLYMTDRLPFLRRTPESRPTNNSYTKGEPSNPNKNSDSNSPSGTQNDKGSSTHGPLVVPTGNFVSSHHPSLSNNPSGSGYLTSTCSTSPGATCQISFTKDGVTKALAPEVTDAGGAAYWNNWRLQDLGLTEGSWTVTATAKLGGQTQTAKDALPLEVGQ